MCVPARLERQKWLVYSHTSLLIFDLTLRIISPVPAMSLSVLTQSISLNCMSCSAQQPKQMQIVHTQKRKQVPRVALCPSRPGQITFQDWVWFTFGPISGWHTYRKKPGNVSSLSPWLILKEVLNISAPLSLHPGLLDTQALRVTQQQATFFSCRLLGCQLPLLQRLC